MEDAVQILLVFFGPGWLTTAKLGGPGIGVGAAGGRIGDGTVG